MLLTELGRAELEEASSGWCTSERTNVIHVCTVKTTTACQQWQTGKKGTTASKDGGPG